MATHDNKQCDSCGLFFDCEKCNGKYHPPCFDDIEKKFTNSQQKLKAEIAALVTWFDAYTGPSNVAIVEVINKLRQLSAVYRNVGCK